MDDDNFGGRVFGFFFILMIVSGLLMFFTFGLHYLFYDYGVNTLGTIGKDLIGQYNASSEQITNINNTEQSYLSLTQWYDILFLSIIVGLFIESTIAAVGARTQGFFSFFGYVTIGNIFLITIMSYAIQIRGWFLNEIMFRIILPVIDAPIMTFFFNNSIYIGVIWYLWLLAVNQIDIAKIKNLANEVINKFSGGRLGNDQDNDENLDMINDFSEFNNLGKGGFK